MFWLWLTPLNVIVQPVELTRADRKVRGHLRIHTATHHHREAIGAARPHSAQGSARGRTSEQSMHKRIDCPFMVQRDDWTEGVAVNIQRCPAL